MQHGERNISRRTMGKYSCERGSNLISQGKGKRLLYFRVLHADALFWQFPWSVRSRSSWPPARRAYGSERRKLALLPRLFYQFFSEVFPERVQINVLYISMVQMDMPFFGSSLGLSGQDPSGA